MTGVAAEGTTGSAGGDRGPSLDTVLHGRTRPGGVSTRPVTEPVATASPRVKGVCRVAGPSTRIGAEVAAVEPPAQVASAAGAAPRAHAEDPRPVLSAAALADALLGVRARPTVSSDVSNFVMQPPSGFSDMELPASDHPYRKGLRVVN